MKATGIQNTYFLIKNLTERMVMTYCSRPLRLCILRPTIVMGVQRAPYPGYVGNTSGITGCFLATAIGATLPMCLRNREWRNTQVSLA